MLKKKELENSEFQSVSPTKCKWRTTEYISRMTSVIYIAQNVFDNSAITNERMCFNSREVELAREFILKAAPSKNDWPITGSNWFDIRGPFEHIELCAKINGFLAGKLLDIDTSLPRDFVNLMEVVGWLHDTGRLVDHQFFATDMATDKIFEAAAVNRRIKSSQHSIFWYWDQEKTLDFDTITIAQRISVISDVMAKRLSSDANKLRDTSTVLTELRLGKEKYLKKSPEALVDHVMRSKIIEYGNREEYLINKLLNWLKELNIDIDSELLRLGKIMNKGKI